MRTAYFKLPGIIECYAEYPSVLRGRTFFDYLGVSAAHPTLGPTLMLYAGALHIILDFPTKLRLHRSAPAALAVTAVGALLYLAGVGGWALIQS